MAETEEGPRQDRGWSVLGHPVAGLLPISLLGVGWVLLAHQVMPRLREARALAAPETSLSALLSPSTALGLLAAVTAGLLLLGVALFIVWARNARGFGPLTDGLLRRNEVLAGLLLLTVGVLTCGVISRGEPVSPRALSHVAQSWLWHESLRSGTFPRWTDLWFGGFPAGQHFPPLTHLIAALLGFLHFSPFDSAKELAWFTRIAGGIGFGLLCARVHRDQRSGYLGGLIYALAPTFHSAWMVDGRLPATFLLGVLPWGLYMAERLAGGIGGYRSGAILALSIGAIALSSIAQSRLTFVLILGYLLARAVPILATRGERVPSTVGVLIGLVGGLALATGFIVPLVRDASLLNAAVPESLGSLHFHFPDFAGPFQLLSWDGAGRDYIGVSIVVLAIAGSLRVFLDRRAGTKAIGPIPILVMVLLPWTLVPFSARYLDLMPLGLQLAAAAVVRREEPRASVPFPRRGVFPVAMLILLADLAPISLSSSYRATPDPRHAALRTLEGRLGSGRFLELPLDATGMPMTSYSGFAVEAPVASAGGPYLEGAPRSFAPAAAVIDSLARAIHPTKPVDPDLIRLAALHDIRMVLFTVPEGIARPEPFAAHGFEIDDETPALGIPEASPVWILEPGDQPGPGPLAGIVTEKGLAGGDRRRLVGQQIDWIRAARPRPVPEARAVVLPNRLEIEIPDLGPVTIRVARNAYPQTEVLVDDRRWPWREAPFGGIEVDLERGPHRIRIESAEDRLRRAFRYGQWALAGLLLLIALGPRRR